MDGVIRNNSKVPIYEGISLYKAINANGTVALACDDAEEAQRWCKQHNLNDVDAFISDKTIGEYEDKPLLKVQHQQAQGVVHFVITADVDTATTLMANGVKTLLFLHPIYQSAKFRPDGREGRKSWDALVGELDRQITMKMEDDRL